MENINFIPANNLPEAEGEEVSVLCLENGELKQKPGASLGGEKADLVFKLTSPIIFGNQSSENTTIAIESGSLDAVMETLRAGNAPVVKVKHFALTDPDIPIIEGGVYDCAVLHYGEHIHFSFAIAGRAPAAVRIVLVPDDPGYLEVWVHPATATSIQVI